MYVLSLWSLWHEKNEQILNFLNQFLDINFVSFNHIIAPLVDVCVRLCMGGVCVIALIGAILSKEYNHSALRRHG